MSDPAFQECPKCHRGSTRAIRFYRCPPNLVKFRFCCSCGCKWAQVFSVESIRFKDHIGFMRGPITMLSYLSSFDDNGMPICNACNNSKVIFIPNYDVKDSRRVISRLECLSCRKAWHEISIFVEVELLE